MRRRWVMGGIAVVLIMASVTAVRAATTSSAHNRAVLAFVGDSNLIRGAGPIVQDLTYGPNIFNNDHSDNNYVPVFILRAGSGLRSPDCASTATTCATNNF